MSVYFSDTEASQACFRLLHDADDDDDDDDICIIVFAWFSSILGLPHTVSRKNFSLASRRRYARPAPILSPN